MLLSRVLGKFCKSALYSSKNRMPPKKAAQEAPKPLLGRPSNNLKMGVVGLPNVGYPLCVHLSILIYPKEIHLFQCRHQQCCPC